MLFMLLKMKTVNYEAFPIHLVGTDSHTTMINGIGVLGWGVGGIEAEAGMLGQPSYFPVPEVVGVKLVGELPNGATATDLALKVTQVLRKQGVVGKFVEFFGPGCTSIYHLLTVQQLQIWLLNMVQLVDSSQSMMNHLNYMRLTGRAEEQIKVVETYCKENGLFFDPCCRASLYKCC